MLSDAPEYGVFQMSRRAWLLTLVGVAATPQAVAAKGFHVRGTLTATDQEAQEGYFALTATNGATKEEVMVATKPGSPIHDDLRAMVGKTVQVSVFES